MPVKYLPYFPEPIEGQAILDNFTRTRRMLKYRGHNDVEARLTRGMPLYEVEEVEKVNGGGDNLVIRGECVSACAYLKEKGIKVDLVYIDPPFASGADYAKKIYLRKNPKAAEALETAGAELEDNELKAFEEKMYGDIWQKEQYLNWMYENLVAIRSVMSETASIYVHLDWHIGHYIKVLMDEVFGEANFRNEIIWQRTSAHVGANRYGSVHDTIFFYTFNEEFTWNELLVPYNEAYLDIFLDQVDENGERYKRTDLTGAGTSKGSSGNPWRGINPSNKGRHWTVPDKVILSILGKNADPSRLSSQQKLDLLDANGKIHWPKKKNGMPRLKQYREDLEGVPPQDLLLDIRPLHNQSSERRGYDTQKPEALVERFIEISTNGVRDDGTTDIVVADFFGGSGTTANAAFSKNRKFVVADVGIHPIQLTRDELHARGAALDVIDVKDGVSLFRNPVQTKDKLKTLIHGLRNEDALDSFWEGSIAESKNGMVPVYVPNLLDHSSKVLDVATMARIVYEAMPALPDDVVKVIVYYVDIEDREALQKFIKNSDTNIKIELRDLKEVLDNVVLGDVVEYETKKAEGGYEVEIKGFVSDRLQQKIDEFNEKRRLQMQKKRQPLIEMAEIGEVEDEPEGGFSEIIISEDGLELVEMLSLDCTNSDGSWKSDSEIKIDKNSYVIRNGTKTKDFWDGKILSKKKPKRLKVRNIAGDETVVSL